MSVFIGSKTKRVELAERKDAINPNLFTGSKDFTGNWLNLSQAKQKDKYLDLTAVYVDWQWNGISQYIDVKKDEVLTVSAYIKAKAGSPYFWYTTLNSDNEDGHTAADTSPTNQSITAMGDWQKTSFTFTATSDGTIKPRIENSGTTPFWLAGMKLEKGTVATPWCPAYGDYAWEPDITNLQNQIQADKTDVTNLQSMITGLSTKVDSITTKLSDGTLVQVAHFEASDEQKAVDWSKDDGKGGLPKLGIIDG